MRFPEYLNSQIEDKGDLIKISETIYGIPSHIKEQKEDAKNKNLTLLIVSGFSGAGKDSIVSGLINKDRRFGWVKTCTTRERRPEETEENDAYIRLTEETFQEALNSGDVVESVEYAGNHYCSLTSVFERAFDQFEVPILRIEPVGSRHYSELWKKNIWLFSKVNLIYVFIVPPSIEVLRERLLKRSGDPKFVEKRVAQMARDLTYVGDAEYIVINETGKLETVVDDLTKLIFS